MRSVLLLCVVTASASGASHLFCSCRDSRPGRSLVAHCQDNSADVNCVTALVKEVTPGYTYIPGYAMVKLYRVHRTWDDAVEVCKANGGRLAMPSEEYTFNGLRQILQKEPAIKSAYIGKQADGDTDGKPAPVLRRLDGEPNRVEEPGACCVLEETGSVTCGLCGDLNAFFCERRLSAVVPVDYHWVPEVSRFYKVHSVKQTYAMAAETCHSENASLALPDTWRRVEAITDLLKLDHQQYFVGFTDETKEGDFVAENGRHLRDMEFQNWDTGEPNNGGRTGPENCLTIRGSGVFNDYLCGTALPFICEILPV